MRVFVSAWVGSENIGDELLFACLKRRLEQLGAEVVVASKDPDATRRAHGVEAVHHYDGPALARALLRSDGLVFGGGGLIQDGTSALSLPYHMSRLVLAKAERVPFIGLGLGVGPLRFRMSRWLLRQALSGHRGLTVRDQHSATLLDQCGVIGAKVTSDMVFSLEPLREAPREEIVLALRSYRDSIVPERFSRHAQDDRMEATLANALDETVRRTKLHLRFLAFEGERDERFNRRVTDRMTTRDFSFAKVNVGNIMEEVSRGRLAIAMRYHGGVTAVVAEKPVVLIGYAPKVAALAAELADECRYIEHDAEAIAALPDHVDALLGRDAGGLRLARSRLQELERGNVEVLTSFIQSVRSGSRRAAAPTQETTRFSSNRP